MGPLEASRRNRCRSLLGNRFGDALGCVVGIICWLGECLGCHVERLVVYSGALKCGLSIAPRELAIGFILGIRAYFRQDRDDSVCRYGSEDKSNSKLSLAERAFASNACTILCFDSG